MRSARVVCISLVYLVLELAGRAQTAPSAPVQVNPGALSFTAAAMGDSPGAQRVEILAASGGAASFTVALDSGQANTPAPTWINVFPRRGTTPARLTVTVDPSSLSAGTYNARILIDAPGYVIVVPVALTTAFQPPQLTTSPISLRYTARAQAPGTIDQTVVIKNGGSGTLPFTVSVPKTVAWVSVTPTTGQAGPNTPVYVHVVVNSAGLATGAYRAPLLFSSGNITVRVPVAVYVAGPGAILSTDQAGLRFEARSGQGTGSVQQFSVLDYGDAGSAVFYTAEVVNGANYISVSPASGTATPAREAVVNVSVNSNGLNLAPGGHYALIRISDPNALNSPQYVPVVLDVGDPSRPPRPDPNPQGFVFAAAANGSAPDRQLDNIFVNSASPVPFTASAIADDGGAWLNITPATGTVSTRSPGVLTVSVNPAGLKAGTYTGSVNVALSSELRTVNVTFIVAPGYTASAARSTAQAPACAPSRVVLTQVGFVNNFVVPAGWPETLSIAMNDDCGNVINDGSVVATFTNGDPPLGMRSDLSTGTYSATWQPLNASEQAGMTVHGTAGTLTPGVTQLTGQVIPNQAPVLAKNGTINNLNADAALSPGVIAAVFGTGLAAQPASPSQVPLPTLFNNTQVLVGGTAAPMYFASGGQLNVQLPTELQPGQYQILISANGALTLPDTLDVNPFDAGVAAFSNGQTIAQHSDFTLVDASHPAKPGEPIIIYLTGLGATNPAVPSGRAAPSAEPLARVVVQPTVTLDGNTVPILYAGLTPGSVGLYQINFQVPPNARSGALDLVVSQNGVAGNTTQLIVGP